MIMIRETIKQFGYDPREIGKYSHKKVVIKCEKCFKIKLTIKSDFFRCPNTKKLCKRCVWNKKNIVYNKNFTKIDINTIIQILFVGSFKFQKASRAYDKTVKTPQRGVFNYDRGNRSILTKNLKNKLILNLKMNIYNHYSASWIKKHILNYFDKKPNKYFTNKFLKYGIKTYHGKSSEGYNTTRYAFLSIQNCQKEITKFLIKNNIEFKMEKANDHYVYRLISFSFIKDNKFYYRDMFQPIKYLEYKGVLK